MWTLIVGAKNSSSEDYKKRVEYLVSLYWKPVYRYIRVVWNRSNEDAKDLTQEFFSKFLQRGSIHLLSPEKGRLRTYLKAAVKHFMINVKDMEHAQKRGGKNRALSLESLGKNHIDGDRSSSPVDYFDKEWARILISRSIDKLKAKLKSDSKDNYFKIFELHDLDNEKLSYRQIAENLHLKESDVRNRLVFIRRLLKEFISNEIKDYVLDHSHVDDELKYLLSIKF